MQPVRWIKQFHEGCAALDPFWTIAMMTLLIMVRYEGGAWYFAILNPVMLGMACIFPKVIRTELFWLAVTVLTAAPLVLHWYYLSAHSYLLCYWTLALLLSFFASKPMLMLAHSARWLTGSVFLCASIWKLLSPDFNSGTTMRFFMADTLPLGLTTGLFTGLSASELYRNIEQVNDLLNNPSARLLQLHFTPRLVWMADALTRLIQLIESLIACIFFIPWQGAWTAFRELSLIFFFLTAYTILPVAPFATLFAVLGYAIAHSPYSRTFFIAAFFIFQLVDLTMGRIWNG